MRIEKEMKLIPNEHISNINRTILLKNIYSSLTLLHIIIDSTAFDIHEDIYFDTFDFLLYSSDTTLRLRRNQNRLILKVKKRDSVLSLYRVEYQRYLNDNENLENAVNIFFQKHVSSANLHKVLKIYLKRDSIYISTGVGKYQVCIDEYACHLPIEKIVKTYIEVEVETIQSSHNDIILKKFIDIIMSKCGLVITHRSKYQIGLSTYIEKEKHL